MNPPEITVQERAEFWRKRHDLLLAQFTVDKARYEFEALSRALQVRAEQGGYQMAQGQDGEPIFVPKATDRPGPIELKKEA